LCLGELLALQSGILTERGFIVVERNLVQVF
jgi:hypothetical protein